MWGSAPGLIRRPGDPSCTLLVNPQLLLLFDSLLESETATTACLELGTLPHSPGCRTPVPDSLYRRTSRALRIVTPPHSDLQGAQSVVKLGTGIC